MKNVKDFKTKESIIFLSANITFYIIDKTINKGKKNFSLQT